MHFANAMELTDINDAYATRINPVGANNIGGSGGGGSQMLYPQSSANEVVIMQQMPSSRTTVPHYPDSVVTDALRTQQAGSNHGVYEKTSAPFIDSTTLYPVQQQTKTVEKHTDGYLDRMGLRRKDVTKLVLLSLMVTFGISLHWFVSQYVGEWIEASDFDDRQLFFVRLMYPALVLFVLWNVKAYQ
jgi:hypothetical protein